MPKQRLSEELWHTLGSLGIRKPFRSRRKRRSSADTGYPVVKSTGTPNAPLGVVVQDSPSRVPLSLAPCVPNLMICNLRSLAPKVYELECVMEFNGVDIVCITETWLTNEIPDSHVSLKDFTLFRKDRPSHCGGLVAYIRSSIPCVLLPKLELRSSISEIMWLHVKPFCLPRSVSSILIGIYHPPHASSEDNNVLFSHVQETVDWFLHLYPEALVCVTGDYNPASTNISSAVFKRMSGLTKS